MVPLLVAVICELKIVAFGGSVYPLSLLWGAETHSIRQFPCLRLINIYLNPINFQQTAVLALLMCGITGMNVEV
jgi:hypothetical protein